MDGPNHYDVRTGRWTAPDPIGDKGGDPDWYGYCLDDPVNAVDSVGLMGSKPESPESEGAIPANKVQWQANPGACEKCNELDGQYFSQGNEPEKPHPNCNCKIVECYYVNEYSRWEEISRSVPSYNMQNQIFTQFINSTLVLWTRSYYIVEERKINICIGCGTRREVLETNTEHRKRKIQSTEYSTAYCASTTKIDEWSVWWCANP